jgi:chromosome segregation ATPase
MEIKQLQDKLSKTHLDLEASHGCFREAVQSRDAHLAAAETQVLSLKGHIEVLEGEVKRLTDQMAAREKDLTTMYDERLHLELKQQQLRFDRRLQVPPSARYTCLAVLNPTASDASSVTERMHTLECDA